ncbi:uncharacterized protein I303_101241 [Kwoniella dejecticola CBS 10117]|uniref:CBF1-interacting co-repressor CIR N-terminal domain-containing protein n=1 Tax=Kwoniella dejecticola CBS 10117 TaxID=1296121 RepID=A0A1A6AH85_9TREE|nr:uncharacterized protein I303_01248 [Kwoniella dejecticola CBS 10117]OBR89421.1 hypothetical protein I303_01248 [Kwoniella dejecticola CBS 10117]
MPRLQILHHKSYHPYLEKNKQRVRDDEARAKAEELAKEQLQIDADAADRLDALRRRAGSPAPDDNLPSTSTSRDAGKSLLGKHLEKKAREEKRERKQKARLDFDFPSETARRNKGKEKERPDSEENGGMGTWETGGHLNLFADLERDPNLNKPAPTLAEIAKAKKDQESDPFTLYLGRPDKETKPWYADKDLKRIEDREVGEEAEERRERDRRKDARSKNRNDPLTHISTLLSTSTPKPRSSNHKPHYHHHQTTDHRPSDPAEARKSREISERERALALIAKSKVPPRGPRTWDDTPSSAGGGRSWAEEWEREQAKAGRRFFEKPPHGGRSWEV